MTDTEAKALVRNLMLIATNKALPINYRDYATGAANYIEATGARHTAELREQAERFSEAVASYSRLWSKRTPSRDEYNTHFAPFILPAFPDGWPEAGYEPHYGMTLRDWFAGQALSNPAICTASSEYPHLDAYAFADAMLAERQKALVAAALKARGV